MEKHEFEIRAYGKSELAMMYAPELTESGAWKQAEDVVQSQPAAKVPTEGQGQDFHTPSGAENC